LNQSSASRYCSELIEMMKGNPRLQPKRTAANNPHHQLPGHPDDLGTWLRNPRTALPETDTATDAAARQAIAQWQVRDWLYRLKPPEIPGTGGNLL